MLLIDDKKDMDDVTRERICGLVGRSEALRITVEGGDFSLTVRDREFCHDVALALRKVARKRRKRAGQMDRMP